jgi:hypothetical protein
VKTLFVDTPPPPGADLWPGATPADAERLREAARHEGRVAVDCRGASPAVLSAVGRFVEDREGAVAVYADDPLPGGFLARFDRVEKRGDPIRGAKRGFDTLALLALPEDRRRRVSALFDAPEERKAL